MRYSGDLEEEVPLWAAIRAGHSIDGDGGGGLTATVCPPHWLIVGIFGCSAE